MRHIACVLAGLIGLVLIAVAAAAAQDPSTFYEANCAPCHSIGGGAQGGPDLKDVTARRSRAWIVRFMLNPEAVIAAKDPVSLQLVKDADGMVMPATPDLTPELAEGIVRMIEQRSGRATPAPTPADEKPLSDQDAALGSEIFTGGRRLANHGPACLSCHDLAGLRRLGGGTFGPDLTRVHRRLGGNRGLVAWLGAPPTPMMRTTYRSAPLTPEERRSLTAFLEKAAAGGAGAAPSRVAGPLGVALVGSALSLGGIGLVWRRRLRAVRQPLVDRMRETSPPASRTSLVDRQPIVRRGDSESINEDR